MIRSSNPSPFRSPALLSAWPDSVDCRLTIQPETIGAVQRTEVDQPRKMLRPPPNTT